MDPACTAAPGHHDARDRLVGLPWDALVILAHDGPVDNVGDGEDQRDGPAESDLYTYDQLRGALESEAAKGVSLLIVDLSGLAFMDSAGVQVLLDIRAMMSNRGGKLALAGPQNTVARVFNLVGADQLIPVYASVEEAQAGTQLC
jgi:anti-anti-sigma factor